MVASVVPEAGETVRQEPEAAVQAGRRAMGTAMLAVALLPLAAGKRAGQEGRLMRRRQGLDCRGAPQVFTCRSNHLASTHPWQ